MAWDPAGALSGIHAMPRAGSWWLFCPRHRRGPLPNHAESVERHLLTESLHPAAPVTLEIRWTVFREDPDAGLVTCYLSSVQPQGIPQLI